MRCHPSRRLVTSLALVAACGTSDRPADAPADAAPAAEPAAPTGPAAIVTVIYNTPKDTAAFETYYRDVHLPLVSANQQEIGFTRADLTKFTSTLDGKQPTYYRQAELYFPSMEAARAGMGTPGFKKVGDDLANFASGGLIGMVATETSEATDASEGDPMAIVTVLYKQPQDTAAFERYYAENHLPLVAKQQPEIGFTKAELTRFVSNLDGSPPALYRQAELYFPTMDALKKGMATEGFKQVAGDLPNFATGGLEGLIAVETR
jgi:uncharacterized protein (TIGR02118 family)